MELQECTIEPHNGFLNNRYVLLKMHKPTILFMCITRFGKKSLRHDIAFITDDYKFYYFNLRFGQKIHHISYIHYDKIYPIFRQFNINQNTDLVIQDTVDYYCPLFMYFKIISPYAKFKLMSVSLSKMMKRIYYKHATFSKQVTKGKVEINVKNVNMFLYRAWERLILTEECPWITKAVDRQLHIYSDDERKHQIRARICLYYILVKRNFMIILLKSITKNNLSNQV